MKMKKKKQETQEAKETQETQETKETKETKEETEETKEMRETEAMQETERAAAELARDEELSAFVDGELTAEREAELRRELAQDPELRARVAALERVDSALRALALREAPPGLLAETKQKLSRARRHRPIALRAGGAALAAAAASVLYLSFGTAGREGATGERVEPGAVSAFDGLTGVSDEELGIALDYEMLEDIDVLENLEALEILLARDARSS